MGFALKEHQVVEECQSGLAPWLLAGMVCWLPPPSSRVGHGTHVSVSRHWSQATRTAGSIPGPGTPCTIPSAGAGLLTGSDSCDSALATVAGETRVKQGGKDYNYLLTRFHISLLSEWFCFLIYFDLLEN